MRTLVWFRGKDLRVADHLPLSEAAAAGEVIPVFILEPAYFGPGRRAASPHRMQFLLDALAQLATRLQNLGSRLVLIQGPGPEAIPRVAAAWNVDRVVAQRRVEPGGRAHDDRVRAALGSRFRLYDGETLVPPGSLRTGNGRPYSVFTPFARAFARDVRIANPVAAPPGLPPLPQGVQPEVETLPTCASQGIRANPRILQGGERAARERLEAFLAGPAAEYRTGRNLLGRGGTSRLSADLKFGTLSPRQVWSAAEQADSGIGSTEPFLNQLIWREFAYSTLWDRPDLLRRPFRPEFERFPWQKQESDWLAWVNGHTGYPVVDAAARQLLATGYVHNRARMIAASFLTKHLLIDYRRGEAHYFSHLTDGDRAQNNLGWQWSAGCGCDAQPYFRVFNPMLQGRKFDADGGYVREWVPELARLPAKYIHCPWEAPAAVLDKAGVRLGQTYPAPVVGHRAARERYLRIAGRHVKRFA